MKNIFPSGVTLHLKFDLKGSTYGRKVPNSLKKNFQILARRLKRRGQKRLQRSKISTSLTLFLTGFNLTLTPTPP